MSIRYSMPEWILELWGRNYDDETVENMCRALLLDRPTAIRVNMEHTSPAELRAGLEQAGIKVEETKLEDAFLISGYDYLGSLPAFLRGDFYVQDLSAMQVAHAADVQPGWNVIDVCAAPGGKAIHVAQLLGGTGHVEARDLTEYKVGLIEENIERCRVENMSVKVWDATQPDTTAADTADLVIADLPCSGLGILHKKPDIKYQMTPAQAGELAALQRRILAQVQHFVKPGGRLLYSTCTVNPAENEENADWFADSFPDFTKRSGQQILPDEIRDGFYIAVFDRRT
jgi:16S rRNA (cytosine967-C5)-methyltransferase